MAEHSLTASPVDAYWHACTALTIAGFEMPEHNPQGQGEASDFELLFDVGAGLELALRYSVASSVFDIEIRLPQAEAAIVQATLLLVRTVDELKCSVHVQTGQFCLTRRTGWLPDASAEDMAVLIAELVVLGHNLTEARAPTAAPTGDVVQSALIRG